MKKTLLVTMDFFPTVGGVSEYYERLSECMPSHEWVVLAPQLPAGVSEKELRYTLIRKRFFSTFFWPRWIPLIIELVRIVKKEKIRCILVGQVLPVGTAVRIAASMTGVPYGVSAHGMDLGMASRGFWKKNLTRLILQKARFVAVNSSDTARRAEQFGVARNHILMLFPCADVQGRIADTRIKENYPVLLTVSRLVKRKGIQYIIEALPKILTHFPTCKYVIAGGGVMRRELAGMVKSMGLADYVEFVGIVSDADKKDYYNECDIFVMAPFEDNGDVEGFGIVYLEANGYGRPVIGTRSGGIPDAVVDGETGILVEEKNSDAIADAVLLLARDKAFAHRLGAQGYSRVKQEFQWPVQAKKLEKILTYL